MLSDATLMPGLGLGTFLFALLMGFSIGSFVSLSSDDDVSVSVYEFFVSDRCDFHVNIRDADVQLGIDCLRVMTMQLRFNICKLDDSRLPNADIRDLPFRVKENVSDTLQYSCLHWLNHICIPLDDRDRDQCMLVLLGCLKKFFEGLYPLFWIEVLSVMGMVTIGA